MKGKFQTFTISQVKERTENKKFINIGLKVLHKGIYILLNLLLVLLIVFWKIGFPWIIILFFLINIAYGMLKYYRIKNFWTFDREAFIKYWKNQFRYLSDFVSSRVVSLFSSIGVVFIGLFLIIDVFPYSPKRVMLYNPTTGQTIIYQGMIHVASNKFYTEIKKDIARASEQGYVLYYEEVGTSGQTPEEYQKNIAYWIAEYKNQQKALWGVEEMAPNDIVLQKNHELLYYANEALLADITSEQLESNSNDITLTNEKMNIKKIREESDLINLAIQGAGYKKGLNDIIKKINDGEWSGGLPEVKNWDNETRNTIRSFIFNGIQLTQLNIEDIDIYSGVKSSSERMAMLQGYMNSENRTLAYTTRGLMNLTFTVTDFLEKTFGRNILADLSTVVDDGNNYMQDRVLAYRNKVLVSYIMKYKDPKVFVTYGQSHFMGFLEELNKASVARGEGKFMIIDERAVRAF